MKNDILLIFLLFILIFSGCSQSTTHPFLSEQTTGIPLETTPDITDTITILPTKRTNTSTPSKTSTSTKKVPTSTCTPTLPYEGYTEDMILTNFGEDTIEISEKLKATPIYVNCTELNLEPDDNPSCFPIAYIPKESGVTDISEVETMRQLPWDIKEKFVCVSDLIIPEDSSLDGSFDILVYTKLYESSSIYYSKYIVFKGDYPASFIGSHTWWQDENTIWILHNLWTDKTNTWLWKGTWHETFTPEYLKLGFVSLWSIPPDRLNDLPIITLE